MRNMIADRHKNASTSRLITRAICIGQFGDKIMSTVEGVQFRMALLQSIFLIVKSSTFLLAPAKPPGKCLKINVQSLCHLYFTDFLPKCPSVHVIGAQDHNKKEQLSNIT